MTAKQVIKKLEKDGWFKVNQEGSHIKFKHPDKKGIVVVPNHGNKDIPIGTLKNIEKLAQMKLK